MRRLIAGLFAALSLVVSPALVASPAMTARDPYTPASFEGVTHPIWSKQAVIYQINTRQFTPAGTLRAAQGELPRLKALGVDILWLMPVQPIVGGADSAGREFPADPAVQFRPREEWRRGDGASELLCRAAVSDLAAVPYPGQWREEGDTDKSVEAFDKGTSVTLAPWSSRLFTRRI